MVSGRFSGIAVLDVVTNRSYVVTAQAHQLRFDMIVCSACCRFVCVSLFAVK